MARSIQKPERRALAFGTLSFCLAAFALVIWIKMRVVTSVPRTAYADPEQSILASEKSERLAGDAEDARLELPGEPMAGTK